MHAYVEIECRDCNGHGGGYLDVWRGGHATVAETCTTCDGTGVEEVPSDEIEMELADDLRKRAKEGA